MTNRALSFPGAARLAALLVLAAGAAGAQPPPSAPPPAASPPAATVDPASFPEVVARVNGREVTKRELLTQAQLIRMQSLRGGAPDPAQSPAFYREILDGLIGELLMYDESAKGGGAASDEDVERAFQGLAGRFPDEAAFDAALAQQGTDRVQVREQLRRSITLDKVIRDHFAADISIDEGQVRAFYDENRERMRVPERRRVRHILLPVEPTATAEEKAAVEHQAEELAEKVRGGEDFAALAAAHSADINSKDKGGELQWMVRSGRLPLLEDAVFGLTQGKVAVAETRMGYHVLELLEVQPEHVRSFEETRPEIEQYLRDLEVQRRVQERVEALRAKAEIQILI